MKDLTIARCGHSTALRGILNAYGETLERCLFEDDQGMVEYCLACHEKMAIACAWCGLPIFTGDPVTLYTPTESNFKLRAGAQIFSRDPLRLVGCLRWSCTYTNANRAGFWMPPGKVDLVPSPLKRILFCPNRQHIMV